MDREEMRKLQSIRLRRVVEHVYHNSPFYRKKMQELGVVPQDIQSIDDITKLPFTVKQDLRDNYPFGLMAVPMSEIVRLHASSGTTGKPIVVGYTRKDLGIWEEVVARCLTAYGLSKNDSVQVSYGYGMFTGGLGLHGGVQNIGGTVIPMSSGNTQKQIQLMHDFGAKALACTPSYALYLAETIRNSGIPLDEFKLRVGIFGAEPWTENMRKELEEKMNIKAYDIYGLTEICGPGVGGECECQNGTHLWEDHFFPEIVDPKTLQPVEPGQMGELVFTTLTKEGMPMIRYRTRDLTHLIYEKCECGRTAVRMGRILGRSDDMWRKCFPISSRIRNFGIAGIRGPLPDYCGSREQYRYIPDPGRSPSGILLRRNEQDDCFEEKDNQPHPKRNRIAAGNQDCRTTQHRA